MRELAERLLASTRREWFRSKPVFEPYKPITEASLSELEHELNAKLPEDLKGWLVLVGYGDVNEDLSFRREWFKTVEQGVLAGAVIFAQDILGNFYTYLPSNGRIVFFSRSAPEYACVSPSFRAFMEELESRSYKILEWVESLPASPYNWDA